MYSGMNLLWPLLVSEILTSGIQPICACQDPSAALQLSAPLLRKVLHEEDPKHKVRSKDDSEEDPVQEPIPNLLQHSQARKVLVQAGWEVLLRVLEVQHLLLEEVQGDLLDDLHLAQEVDVVIQGSNLPYLLA